MNAAAAARKHWARRRSGEPARGDAPGRAVAWLSALAAACFAAAVLICAGFALYATARDDSRLASVQHAALETALDELHAVFGGVDRFDSGQLALIARRSGLDDLRFDSEPPADGNREMQSLHDRDGRIVGWFSWMPDRAFIRGMNTLWAFAVAFGFLALLAGASAVRATRRLGAAFVHSVDTVRRLTTEDPVTGLPGRRSMLDRLDEAAATRGGRAVAFALADIDGFQDVNDTLGRAGGDTMLRAITERLKAGLPAGAVLGRFDDDEFAVIIASDEARIAAGLGERIAASLTEPIFLDQAWSISASVGVALAPEDGTTGDELQRRAALALRAAKQGGRGAVRRFVPQIHEEHSERRFYLRELEIAVEQNALEVHYQPVVAADGGAVVGVEALARWTHPTRGAIAPSLFIPLAEESGLMNCLGEMVLRRALADGARWPNLWVAVNLSPVQMRSPALVDLVRTLIAETGFKPARVVLEITEGVLIDNPEETSARLGALRTLGIATALDDFGTGYSSLNYLQKFPFDRLKIDRSFVASLGTVGTTGAIIQSVVTLGHALGMKVLAEGVETEEQRVLLRLAGCDEMQGFLFAKARPAAEIDQLLARGGRRSGATALRAS